jgi:hypothetical protein
VGRRVLLVLVGVAVLAGCGARAQQTETRSDALVITSSPEPPPCPEPGVTIKVAGEDAAMGIRVLAIQMVNCGKSAYTVNGYPGVRLYDEYRKPIDLQVGKGSGGVAQVEAFDAPPKKVTLQPGEHVMSSLLWRNLVTDSTVNATNGVYMEISPADGAPWQEVPLVSPGTERKRPIDLGNTRKMGTEAWKKP